MYETVRKLVPAPVKRQLRAAGRDLGALRRWVSNAPRQLARIDRHERLLESIFREVPQEDRENLQFYERMYTLHGALKSSAALSEQAKLDLDLHFQHREKAEVALTAATSWYGGDYMEFGAHDLTTFRNMLTAFDVCRLDQRYPDTHFYAFDIFGSLDSASKGALKEIAPIEDTHGYFAHFMTQGDQYERHLQYIKDHRLFEDRCTLIQGLFQDTLTEERRVEYRDSGRRIGFACIDVNIWPSYKLVFDFIYGLMAEHSYIYMDEFFQNSDVLGQIDYFAERLRDERKIGMKYVRNAAGFGGLVRLYPLQEPASPLELKL